MSDSIVVDNNESTMMNDFEYLGYCQSVESSTISFSEGDVVPLTIVPLPDVVLLPGEALPMRDISPQSHEMIQQFVRRGEDRFGIVLLQYNVGTVVQITDQFLKTSTNDNTDMPPHIEAIVAKATQRFDVVEWISDRRYNIIWRANVRIMKEREDNLPLGGIRRASLSQYSYYHWGSREYDLYDATKLVKRIQLMLKNEREWTCLALEDEGQQMLEYNPVPGRFAYWIATKLPLSNVERQQVIELESTVYRLQHLIVLLNNQLKTFYCSSCGTELSSRSEVITITGQHGQGTFVNPNGYVHQILTLKSLEESLVLVADDAPCSQDSWFAGYAWTIVNCLACRAHLGWRFDSTSSNSFVKGNPQTFWGIRRQSMTSYPAVM